MQNLESLLSPTSDPNVARITVAWSSLGHVTAVECRQQALQQSLQIAAEVADAEHEPVPSYYPPLNFTSYGISLITLQHYIAMMHVGS